MNGALPERTRTYLRDGAQNGQRNDELLHAACQFRDARYSESAAIDQLVPRARADGLSRHEATATIHSAFSRGAREQIGTTKHNGADSTECHYRRIQIKPAPLPKPMEQSAVTFLETVFREGELISIAETTEKRDEDGKIRVAPNAGRVRSKETWIADIETRGMDAVFKSTDGLFVRINPLRDANGKTDKDVAAYRHILVESDEGTREEQLGALQAIGLPISVVTDSGDRSIHGLVDVDAPDEATYRERFGILRQYCTEALGLKVDEKNKNPSRFNRMPGAKRARRNHDTNERILGKDGKPILDNQTLLATNLPGKPWDEWAENLPIDDGLDWLKFDDVEELPDEEPPVIIEGLLRINEKLGVTAGSKSFKTWLLLYIAYCVANGLDFLGHKTHAQKVVFFDLELSKNALKRRLKRIQKTLGEGDFTNLKVVSLRGKARLFCANFQKVASRVVATGFKVVIIDPVYKFLLGKEENSNGMVADMLEDLTAFCMEAQVALIHVHHHSKGNQADKDALDRGSGAGAWSRDADALMDITKHKQWTKEEPIYTCSITVRDFPPIGDFVVRWKFPILVKDTQGLDPTELKQINKGGRPKDDNTEIIMAVFRAFEQEGGATAKQVSEAMLIGKRTIQRRIKELIPTRLAKAVQLKNGFQLSLKESEKMKKFEEEQNSEADLE